MADIFLSYERTDRQRVAPIAALLEACGWRVWWDQPADAGWADDKAIEHELAACGCVLAVWSIDAVDSPAVRLQASHGVARGILVCVSIDFSRPPPELEQAPLLAFAGWTGDASSPRAQELLAVIGGLLKPPPASLPSSADSDLPAFFGRAPRPGPVEVETHPAAEADPAAESGVGSDLEEQGAEEAWANRDAEEDEADHRLPAVLLRDPVQRPPDLPPTPAVRRGLAVGLLAGLAIVVAAATLWKTVWPGGLESRVDVAAVKTVPEPKLVAVPTPASLPKRLEIEPRPVALPPPTAAVPDAAMTPRILEIEDLLVQVTPRVEELLAGARRLIRMGDIRGAREVLETPETVHSGLLTFLLAETYDPNVLPATLKGVMADPERARTLYRKARELGDDRAQGRLEALKTSDCASPASVRAARSACPRRGLPG